MIVFYDGEFYNRIYLPTLDEFIMRTKLLSLIIAAVAYSVSFSALADQADIDAELSRYTTIIKGTDYAAQRLLMKRLEWAGYASNRLYDAIADEFHFPASNLQCPLESSAQTGDLRHFLCNESSTSSFDEAQNCTNWTRSNATNPTFDWHI